MAFQYLFRGILKEGHLVIIVDNLNKHRWENQCLVHLVECNSHLVLTTGMYLFLTFQKFREIVTIILQVFLKMTLLSLKCHITVTSLLEQELSHCRFLVPDNTEKILTEIWHHFRVKNDDEKWSRKFHDGLQNCCCPVQKICPERLNWPDRLAGISEGHRGISK